MSRARRDTIRGVGYTRIEHTLPAAHDRVARYYRGPASATEPTAPLDHEAVAARRSVWVDRVLAETTRRLGRRPTRGELDRFDALVAAIDQSTTVSDASAALAEALAQRRTRR